MSLRSGPTTNARAASHNRTLPLPSGPYRYSCRRVDASVIDRRETMTADIPACARVRAELFAEDDRQRMEYAQWMASPSLYYHDERLRSARC
jgi:hypothetical protein